MCFRRGWSGPHALRVWWMASKTLNRRKILAVSTQLKQLWKESLKKKSGLSGIGNHDFCNANRPLHLTCALSFKICFIGFQTVRCVQKRYVNFNPAFNHVLSAYTKKKEAILKVVVSVGEKYIVIYFDSINTTAFMICTVCPFLLLPNEIKMEASIKLTNRTCEFLLGHVRLPHQWKKSSCRFIESNWSSPENDGILVRSDHDLIGNFSLWTA